MTLTRRDIDQFNAEMERYLLDQDIDAMTELQQRMIEAFVDYRIERGVYAAEERDQQIAAIQALLQRLTAKYLSD